MKAYSTHIEQIAGKLAADNADNLSGAELERCLSGCVCPWVLTMAIKFRDDGVLTFDMVRGA